MSINIYENKPFMVYEANYFRGSDDVTSSVGAYVITDKQSLFKSYIRTEMDGGKVSGHDEIMKQIDGTIYTDNEMDSKTCRRPYNTYILLSKDYKVNFMQFIISLPENGHISPFQYKFLCNALDELEDFDEYACLSPDKRKYISIFNDDNDDVKYFNVEEVREKLSKCVIGYPELHEEKVNNDELRKNGIASEVLSKDEIANVIKFYIDFGKCNTFSDLVSLINLCDIFYNDSYYRDYFLGVFPNYNDVKYFLKKVKSINIDFDINNITFSNLSFENIYDVLNRICEDYGYGTKNKER